jgi:hypothetical protein
MKIGPDSFSTRHLDHSVLLFSIWKRLIFETTWLHHQRFKPPLDPLPAHKPQQQVQQTKKMERQMRQAVRWGPSSSTGSSWLEMIMNSFGSLCTSRCYCPRVHPHSTQDTVDFVDKWNNPPSQWQVLGALHFTNVWCHSTDPLLEERGTTSYCLVGAKETITMWRSTWAAN